MPHHGRCVLGLLLLTSSPALASDVPSLDTATVKPPATVTVGQIFIIGNHATRQSVILDQLHIYSGGQASREDLRRAEERLERLHIFQIDRSKGIRPTVEILDPDSRQPFKDILVTIEEKPFNVFVYKIERAIGNGLHWLGSFPR